MQNTGKCSNPLADNYTLQSIKTHNPFPPTVPNIWRKLPKPKKKVEIADDTEENEIEIKCLKKSPSVEGREMTSGGITNQKPTPDILQKRI